MSRLALLACFALAACKTTAPPEPDRSAFLLHMPRSILVLPPLDETPVATAPYGWLETVTRPLVERGYYVFPVALVDAILRENGLPTPGEMHEVSLKKIDEVFGADAVLYVDLKAWGTSYQVLDSRSTVTVVGRLVDVKTGDQLWQGTVTLARSSNDSNQNGLAGMLIGAIVNQISAAAYDPMPELSREANWNLFHDETDGLLVGPRHPGFAADQEKRHAAAGTAPATASTTTK